MSMKGNNGYYLHRCTHDRTPASTDNHYNWQFFRLHTCVAAAVTIAINQGGNSGVLIQLVPGTCNEKSMPISIGKKSSYSLKSWASGRAGRALT
jgi:hypothetical protein